MYKKTLIGLVLFYAFLTCSGQTYFSGVWHWSASGATFTLNLIQKNDSLSGYHCAVAQNGNRIDCQPNHETTIQGMILRDSAIVTFKSLYSRKYGTAIIRKTESGSLFWKISIPPSDQYFLPDSVILTRLPDSEK